MAVDSDSFPLPTRNKDLVMVKGQNLSILCSWTYYRICRDDESPQDTLWGVNYLTCMAVGSFSFPLPVMSKENG